MLSHFRVNATPVTFTFTLPTPSVTLTKRRPSWWNRLRKQPGVDWIVKLMASILIKELMPSRKIKELFGRVLEDLFLRVENRLWCAWEKPCSVNAVNWFRSVMPSLVWAAL